MELRWLAPRGGARRKGELYQAGVQEVIYGGGLRRD